ncbi:glutamine synthetase [Candidatus Roizmanbacteria bacterium RIFCSPHIGHO2_01_FULL_39_8]|uniref:Glutamine synthetase n=1 Tax=Candidatus Roizmanbacteria bacterium RIFCSPHIGHO2_01_FULL_39_8 TaxID=1802033 RepID=A0A1F7GS21_9BACT|nr:MAG: glutamine synthetase [Candidatus Roizmanbacteria bacterium RIFCSPHIGHO2_01_FULL_39_8]
MDTLLKNFLVIPYSQLEEMNLKAKEKAEKLDPKELAKEYMSYLRKEKRIKALTICFSDIEGRFHMLDYDKKFLLDSFDNLTFDGSSIRGFSVQKESDLRLDIDWSSFRWLPTDVFGTGKVIVFANILDRDKSLYLSDFRGLLKSYTRELRKEQGVTAYASTETEGFLIEGVSAEQNYSEGKGFTFVSSGGYYHSLPLDILRQFIDRSAEAQRAMGFRNEKDHPEVAPSQFELNFAYSEVVRACDNIQLYKLVCRQIARSMGLTASFLPKPAVGINGSGMHLNLSFGKKGKNIFYEKKGMEGLSKDAWDVIYKVLNHAKEICLVLNPSVNAYRRLDPHFEAPNQIKVSPIDRGSMIRIPVANEKSARIEIRSVAPDANPYLVLYTVLKTAFLGGKPKKPERDINQYLPGNIYEAMDYFARSRFVETILGKENKEKYLSYKKSAADRSPKDLGTLVKTSEVIFHHEVTNQMIWNRF